MQPLTQKEVLDKINKSESFEGVEIGYLDFKDFIFENFVDITKAKFTVNVDFSGALFTKGVSFNEAIFLGDAKFLGSTFSDASDFGSSIFNGEANFSAASFTGETFFSGVTFNKEAIFTEATFSIARFSKSIFTCEAFFSSAEFNKESYFLGTTFKNEANFSHVTFEKNAIFSGTSFESDVIFSNVEFNDGAYFPGARFIGEANFSEVKIESNANFSDVTFESNSIFNFVKFGSKADFRNANFTDDTNFVEAEFKNCCNFSSTLFRRKADFDSVMIEKDALFSFAKFDNESEVNLKNLTINGKADFSNSTFTGNVDFSYSTFIGEAYFIRTMFEGITIFRGATFNSEAIFEGIGKTNNKPVNIDRNENSDTEKDSISKVNNLVFSPLFVTDLRNVNFRYPEKIRFNSVCLINCKLVNNSSDLSKISFYDIEWPVKDMFGKKRKIIYDEIVPDYTNKNYSNIKKIYSELVKNCEDKRSFDEAEDFHYGEMEMKRLSYNKFFQKVSLLSFYKYICGFGQNVWLAFFWLLLFVLLLFPIGYLHTGIENKKTLKITEYNLSDNIQSVTTPKFWEDYWDSFGHSIAVSTLKREKLFESVTTSGNLIEGLQIILVSIQVALCIITIRRTFKR